MNAARRFTLIFILLFAGCQNRPSASTLPANQDNVSVTASDAELVRSIGESNGTEQISADNSLVIIRTPAIKRIVERGPAILPELIGYMKTPDLDFDHFIRCYSASDQILQNVDSHASVYWQGNCAAEEMSDGSVRFRPGIHHYDKTFKDRVIADIERKFSRVSTARNEVLVSAVLAEPVGKATIDSGDPRSNSRIYEPENSIDTQSTAGIIEGVLREDICLGARDDSEVEVVGGIYMRAAIKRGQPIVADIVQVMRNPDTSFDGFARLYNVCNQIAKKHRPAMRIYWTGSASCRLVDGRLQIVPYGQDDELLPEFRRAVVDDIKNKLLEP